MRSAISFSLRSLPARLFTGALLIGLAACGAQVSFEEREPWRAEAEAACLQSGSVKEGPAVTMVKAIEGPGVCGMEHPLRIASLGEPAAIGIADETPSGKPYTPVLAQWRTSTGAAGAAVPLGSAGVPQRPAAVTPAATLACPMVSALNHFVAETVQPAAARWFGQPVVTIKQISAYSCRGMNDNPNAHISEHAFGNALDIASFTLADGHTITVKNGWRGTPAEQGFLHDVEEGACAMFTTVLAPGSNAYHEDHMHVDLMRRRSGRLICQPHALPGEAAAFLSGSSHAEPPQARTAATVARTATPTRTASTGARRRTKTGWWDRNLLSLMIARDR